MPEDRNCLSWWFPRLLAANVPVPRTEIVQTDADLSLLLDGRTPEGYDEFVDRLAEAALLIAPGDPFFLRTGHGSAKHDWKDTCYVERRADLPQHVFRLVEWSHLVDLMGLPTRVWAVRDLIPTTPLFYAFQGRMPITREFRFFTDGPRVEHVQPYWPSDAIKFPSEPGFSGKLVRVGHLGASESAALGTLVARAGEALGGRWSVDVLQDASGGWWVTDCAEAERSFRYDPETGREVEA